MSDDVSMPDFDFEAHLGEEKKEKLEKELSQKCKDKQTEEATSRSHDSSPTNSESKWDFSLKAAKERVEKEHREKQEAEKQKAKEQEEAPYDSSDVDSEVVYGEAKIFRHREPTSSWIKTPEEEEALKAAMVEHRKKIEQEKQEQEKRWEQDLKDKKWFEDRFGPRK
ncbi:hypothetical protein QBC43DRAFT_291735 [Cladorrhinum sp. PSN259]|nr:hypothetical protein QBC43DRAFT_291735 [Cladorrhinum sp. PSN259]